MVPAALEHSTLALKGGYKVNVLRTPKDARAGKQRFLYSGGLCVPNGFAKPLHTALAQQYDLAAVDINGFDVGGTPPASIAELTHVHRLVLDALGWNGQPYRAGGHSTGGTVARALSFTDCPPSDLLLIQPILKNKFTPQQIQDKVERQCRFWYFAAGARYAFNPVMREFVHRKIRHQYDNWMRLVENGTAQSLLEDITGFSYADRITHVPGIAYVSRSDDLFSSFDHGAVEDLVTGAPNVKVIDLLHHKYGHTWPLTAPDEAVRVLVHGGEPVPPTPYTTVHFEVQEHPVRSTVVGAAVVGALAYAGVRALRGARQR